ncbi:MAG: 23S rRNA pseudouridine(955/2504/2580) synthase RluC [Gammaproteobacteria bacterium]|nr:23S rRNA pseudouridine(955/2504/2580) synthase RluC [Gammaproteobacteria bacterium]
MSENFEKSYPVRQVVVESGHQGQRLDNFLLAMLKGVPKSRIYRIVRKGEVRVNKGRTKASYRLQEGDVVRIPPVRMADKEPAVRPGVKTIEALEQSILYEDKRLLVLNKPPGLAVHGGSGLKFGVIEALRSMRPEEKELELVHRLDRATSGCLMIAKRRSALRTLHELLRTNGVDKRYIALVAGRWERDREIVDAPLAKNLLQGGERVVRVDPDGKQALTRFRVLERFSDVTLVEAELMTGRTHQLRVHLAHLGTPILGDDKYGNSLANRRLKKQGLKRLFLHARALSFNWTEEVGRLRVEAPLEPALEQLLKQLRT